MEPSYSLSSMARHLLKTPVYLTTIGYISYTETNDMQKTIDITIPEKQIATEIPVKQARKLTLKELEQYLRRIKKATKAKQSKAEPSI